jgi:Arc/MetJ-type ribon-helix-helix transcriptional regulator
MVMQTLQIRLSKGLVDFLDGLVKRGIYNSRSDAVRGAVRKSFWDNQVGTIHNTGNSVTEIRRIRKELSKKFTSADLEEINSL